MGIINPEIYVCKVTTQFEQKKFFMSNRDVKNITRKMNIFDIFCVNLYFALQIKVRMLLLFVKLTQFKETLYDSEL